MNIPWESVEGFLQKIIEEWNHQYVIINTNFTKTRFRYIKSSITNV